MTLFALRGRRVLMPEGIGPATVVIDNGVIAEVLAFDQEPGCVVEELLDGVLMPGLVDSHVHINEPGRTEWEGFSTATQAAAAGGITTLVDMPLNCIPVTTSAANFQEKLAAIGDQLWVDCGFWGGVVPESIDDLPGLLDAGVLGVKSFLIDSGVKEFPNVGPDDLRRAMPVVARYGVPYLIHAEYVRDAPPDAGTIGSDYQRFLASRPDSWEVDAIALMIELATEMRLSGIDCRVHIVHLSSAAALGMIRNAREKGLALTVETCPHYLTLNAEEVMSGNTLFKCCPPIRGEENRARLWEAVSEGLIDFIVSDHSPCTPELKCMETGDIGAAWGGIPALQFGLPLIWREARERGLTLVDVSRLMSGNPAAFAGLGQVKGRLAKGCHADLMLFDDATEQTIDREMIRHRHKITPYEHKRVLGSVQKTWLRGRLIYDDGGFVGPPPGKPLLAGQR